MEELLQFLKCISDETRLKILKLLLSRKFCVCELTAALGKSQPCISQHLRRFKELELVVEEKIEQWSYFQINKAVYQKFLQLLFNFDEWSFDQLGLEDLADQMKELESVNLCKKGGK